MGLLLAGAHPFVSRMISINSAVRCRTFTLLSKCKVSLRLQRRDEDTKEETDKGFMTQELQ
jgi:hypothetical protein